jgi:hypothetical protein
MRAGYHGIAREVSKTLERAIWSQAIIGLDFSKKNHMYDYATYRDLTTNSSTNSVGAVRTGVK